MVRRVSTSSSASFARRRGVQIETQEVLDDAGRYGRSLAYVPAWLSVAGGNSVMPPWVRHQFPEMGRLVRRLRDIPCQDSGCDWCRERHDSQGELKRWLGFDEYRPEPTDDDGCSLQQSIVEGMMNGSSALAVLPTGSGKSACYQVPALSLYDKTGGLTVVISPLVALMADQVLGLEHKGVFSAMTINGLLSMPERGAALNKLRLGDASMLIIPPEQLRSVSVRRVLEQPEIGYWLLDDAHCLSKWGTISGLIAGTSGALSERELVRSLSRRCCASQLRPSPIS